MYTDFSHLYHTTTFSRHTIQMKKGILHFPYNWWSSLRSWKKIISFSVQVKVVTYLLRKTKLPTASLWNSTAFLSSLFLYRVVVGSKDPQNVLWEALPHRAMGKFIRQPRFTFWLEARACWYAQQAESICSNSHCKAESYNKSSWTPISQSKKKAGYIFWQWRSLVCLKHQVIHIFSFHLPTVYKNKRSISPKQEAPQIQHREVLEGTGVMF